MASSCMGVSWLFTNFLQPAQGGLKLKFTSNSKLNFLQHVEIKTYKDTVTEDLSSGAPNEDIVQNHLT